ncbi:MAG: hypothetical protein AB7I37_18275 [Pirellulales bacterium]
MEFHPATNGHAVAPSAAVDFGKSEPARARFKRPWLKLLVSLWLIYHLAGLVIAPASVRPSSDLVRSCWLAVGPYLQFLYLNHGFHFFAPDPGPATIVRYVVDRPDGTQVQGQIPDKRTMRPRLLYHRHFMLTEFLGNSDSMDPALRQLHTRALARQICQSHGGQSVSLSKVVHQLPDMEWRKAGLSLEDPQLYVEEPLGQFALVDLQ